MSTLTERLVTRLARRTGPSRRGFLGGAAVLGAALAVDPWSYLTRPASAYDAVCGADNTCAAGYTVFCCTVNAGRNSCPPDSFIGGWWKADNSNFCGGSARYYIDCNAYRDGRYSCHCNTTTCDQRRVACNQFRYGQCNTQIPYSNTGPVLCRVVSCTPPWVQYGAACSSSAATDNNTATHSAPCLSGHQPVGHLDSVTASGNTVHLAGWAYDPDASASSIRVVIYVDGKAYGLITANQARADVNAARHITGSHGFSASLTISTGTHEFACYAINAGAGSTNTLLGTKAVAVNPGRPPVGRLERAEVSGSTVLLSGWVYDPDSPSSPVRLVIYADGKPYAMVSSTVARPDVNAAFGITGTHGWQARFSAPAGRHTYQIYAANVGRGSGTPLIGSHTLVVGATAALAAPARFGLDQVAASADTVRLTGWADDPSAPGSALPIAIQQDGEHLRWVDAGQTATAQHGFDLTLPAATGLHTYTVHAFTGDGAALPVGRRTVAVDQRGSIGELESAHLLGSTVRLTGWAFHPQRPADSVPIVVMRDGALLSRHRSEGARPDINAGYGAAGDPGFDIALTAEPGRHTYTVYAASLEAGRPDNLIGSRTITLDLSDLGAGALS